MIILRDFNIARDEAALVLIGSCHCSVSIIVSNGVVGHSIAIRSVVQMFDKVSGILIRLRRVRCCEDFSSFQKVLNKVNLYMADLKFRIPISRNCGLGFSPEDHIPTYAGHCRIKNYETSVMDVRAALPKVCQGVGFIVADPDR